MVNYVALYSKLTIKADGESAGLRKLSQRIRMSLARGRVEAHPVSDEEPAAKLDDPPGAEPEHKSPAIPDKPDDLPISDAEYAIMRDATARQDNVALIEEGYAHSLDVARWCVRVAKRCGEDEHIACVMGFLHDVYYYATGLKPLNDLNAADYSGWLMDKHGILSPDERARVVAAIRRYKYPCSDCRGLVALLYDAHILSDYTGHSRTVRTCDLKHLMQLVAEWKLLEPQRGQVANTPEAVSNSDRSSLAEVAQTLASQRISWYEGESDALVVAKYWPDAEAFDRLSGEWSAAFVYHCCYEAGFILPVHAPDVEYGFDTVKGWLDFASLLSNGFYHPKGESGFMPERGDIVIFDRLLEDKQPADHMGIVVLTSADRITVAEGNARKSNVSDVIEHSATHHVRGYIRLPNCYQFRRQA